MARGVRSSIVLNNGLRVLPVGRHSRECFVRKRASEGEIRLPHHAWCSIWPSHEWKTGEKAVEYLDCHGRRHPHGTYRWIRYVCNDTGCSARLLVREDTLLQAAGVPVV